jgi:hypothetical protein
LIKKTVDEPLALAMAAGAMKPTVAVNRMAFAAIRIDALFSTASRRFSAESMTAFKKSTCED